LTTLDFGDEVKHVKEAGVVYLGSVDYFMKWYYFHDNDFNIFAFLTSKLRQLCTKNHYIAAKSAKIESGDCLKFFNRFKVNRVAMIFMKSDK
jgi:hypothetical protein